MAFTLKHLLETAAESRGFFLRHLPGLAPETWDWKPYPECKSVRETLLHMIGTDEWVLAGLREGNAPDYMTILHASGERLKGYTPEELIAALKASGQAIHDFLIERYSNTTLETPVHMWSHEGPLGKQVMHLTSENHYHGGQVAYIRMATQPDWNYYAAVYGPEPSETA